MEETPHIVTHFLAAGAEKRLEDYHFLRNTYETITSQEIQLNRILRMLGEDEISLNWRLDLSPIGRAGSRPLYDFDRWANALNLQGSMAYERLRESEQDNGKNAKPATLASSARRVQELRDRRQRFSEQRDYPYGSSSVGSSRSRVLADYETGLVESSAKRQRQAEENRLNSSRSEDKELPERRREKFRTTFADDEKSYGKSESNDRSTKRTSLYEDQENDPDKKRKSSSKYGSDKSGDIELIAFSVRYQVIPSSSAEEGESSPSIRLLCKWASPSSSPDINYFTIERQSGDSGWLPIGKKIDNSENQTQLDVPSSNESNNNEAINPDIPSFFRLKAHLQNGRTFTSKSTDGFLMDLTRAKKMIIPDVEILSPSSVQLTWNDNEKEGNKSTDEKIKNEDQTDKYGDERNQNKDEADEVEDEDRENKTKDNEDRKNKVEDSEDANEDRGNKNENVENVDEEKEEIENEDEENDEIKNKDQGKRSEDNKEEENRNEVRGNKEKQNEARDNKKTKSEVREDKDDQNEVRANKEDQNEVHESEGKPTMYDIEKKEDEQSEWEKVTEVPLSQRSATIDNLTDAKQCQFRLIPSAIEPEETVKASTINTTISSDDETVPDEPTTPDAINIATSSKNQATLEEPTTPDAVSTATSSKNHAAVEEPTTPNAKDTAPSSKNQVATEESTTPSAINTPASSKNQFAFEEPAVSNDDEAESEETIKPDDEVDTEVLTVNNVNEWLSSLHVVPTSSNAVDVDISEEGFKQFDSYKVEYTTADRPNQWKQVSDITHDDPHLTIDKLKQGTDYKFRFTPITSDAASTDETNPSQMSLVLDVKMPPTGKAQPAKDEDETPVATPPQFSIQKLDPTTVVIEAVIPEDEPATFDDVYDVYSKKETNADDVNEDNDWSKVGTIDKEHLSATVEDLEENTAYAFKIDNVTSPSADEETNTVQELKFDTTPVKQYDPSRFLEKIEQSLENVVNGVMQAAAGHQALEESVNKSLNEVIKEVFRDETLVPNEEYGFDTLALNKDLQVYRGPKQMMLQELEVDETVNSSEHYGEIIIHNYRTSQQSVIVREENGNTRVANIDGDILIRNVVSDVILKNERTNHQLAMNIVGQAFLKGVQGSLIASKFKGIIVVKSVHKP